MNGKRLEWQAVCPKCGDSMEMFDDEDNGAYGGFCQNCGYEEPKDYYKDSEGNQFLITKDEALKRRYIKLCPECGEIMYQDEMEVGKCIICQAG